MPNHGNKSIYNLYLSSPSLFMVFLFRDNFEHKSRPVNEGQSNSKFLDCCFRPMGTNFWTSLFKTRKKKNSRHINRGIPSTRILFEQK